MRSRAILAAVLALAAWSAVVAVGAAATARRAPVRSFAFRSCAQLVSHARAQALRTVGPDGIPQRFATGIAFPVGAEGDPGRGAPVAAPAPTTDFSSTNVQEVGVDEPDIVKTDGRRIFVASNGRLHAIAVGAPPRRLGSLTLAGSAHELLLRGNRLLVLSQSSSYPIDVQPVAGGPGRAVAPEFAPYEPPKALLMEVDVSNPAAMRVVRTLEAEGSVVAARLTGATARVAIASPPRSVDVPAPNGQPDTQAGAEARNRAAIRRAGLATWRPSALLRDRRTGRSRRVGLVSCRAVRRPVVFAGSGLLTVLTIDLDRGLPPVDSDALYTDAHSVYASDRSLYVATERWVDPTDPVRRLPPGQATTIHKFEAAQAGRTAYRASGTIRGFLLNQFSLSEYRGVLRAATTDQPLWWGSAPAAQQSQSFVTTLGERAGALVPLGRVGGLGRGERIYAVRFVDDAGFVVTFRQVDPLYTLDLADPARPRVLGELKVQGYSAYLHPVGRDLLIGVGQDATEEGRLRGTQLSLFDVGDLRAPRRLAQYALGQGSHSEVEFDHHAFLHWPATGLTVLPVSLYEPNRPDGQGFVGAIGFDVSRAGGIREAGRVSHPASTGNYAASVRRALVAGGRLYTVSDSGVRAGRLDTLADLGFAAF